MPKRDNWRKALTVSVLIHLLLFSGAGWLGGSLFKAAQIPELIEVELISDPGHQENMAVTTPVGAANPGANSAPSAAKAAVATEMLAEAVADPLPAVAAGSSANSSVAASRLPPAVAGQSGQKRIAAPRLLDKTEPRYPEDARQAGAEGTVAVRLEIKENGQPGDIAVVRSSGRASFDAAAVEAIKDWRFAPAQDVESGRAVRSYTTVSIVFRLRT